MKSSIKIDFADNGKGLQPFINIRLSKNTDDPRDKLLQTFFQELGGDSNWLSVDFFGYDGDTDYIRIYPVSREELKETVEIIQRRTAVGNGWDGQPPNNNPTYIAPTPSYEDQQVALK